MFVNFKFDPFRRILCHCMDYDKISFLGIVEKKNVSMYDILTFENTIGLFIYLEVLAGLVLEAGLEFADLADLADLALVAFEAWLTDQ